MTEKDLEKDVGSIENKTNAILLELKELNKNSKLILEHLKDVKQNSVVTAVMLKELYKFAKEERDDRKRGDGAIHNKQEVHGSVQSN